jgi:hypothetical protein
MLALNKELLKDFETMFVRKQAISIDAKIQNLVKYLHLPVLISKHQDDKYKNPQIAKQGGNFFKVVDKQNDEDLVKATKLKLLLATDDTQVAYPKVNINSDKLSPNFSATYKIGETRSKAIAHIKALLEDASSIEIVDKYLSVVNNSFDTWQRISLNILQTILPQKIITINICCDNNWNTTREQDLSNFCTNWNVVKKHWDNTIHDRYIITDKVEIILSSGISNLTLLV